MKKDLLTKEDIGQLLSPHDPLSVRSVERYISLANVKPAVRGSGRGKLAKFNREDAEKIQAAYVAASQARDQQSTALTTTKPANVALGARGAQQTLADALTAIAAPVRLAEKLLLSIPEAAMLSGVSADKLRSAVKSGKLKAIKSVGRGLGKIHRDELEKYAKSLK
jgi:excisionase family DNA binding protein